MLKQRKKSVFIRLIVSLSVLVCVLFLAAWKYLVPQITNSIDTRLSQLTSQPIYSNTRFQRNGLDVILMGTVKNKSMAIELENKAKEIDGIRVVDSQLKLASTSLKRNNVSTDPITKPSIKSIANRPLEPDLLSELPTIDDFESPKKKTIDDDVNKELIVSTKAVADQPKENKQTTSKRIAVSINKPSLPIKIAAIERKISLPKGYAELLEAMKEHDSSKAQTIKIAKENKKQKTKAQSSEENNIKRISTNKLLINSLDEDQLQSSSFYGVSLNKVGFKDNSYFLDLDSELVLSEVAAKIKDNIINQSIEVTVYATQSELAMKRAVSIITWLIDAGVKKGQLIPKGVYKEKHLDQVFIKLIE